MKIKNAEKFIDRLLADLFDGDEDYRELVRDAVTDAIENDSDAVE